MAAQSAQLLFRCECKRELLRGSSEVRLRINTASCRCPRFCRLRRPPMLLLTYLLTTFSPTRHVVCVPSVLTPPRAAPASPRCTPRCSLSRWRCSLGMMLTISFARCSTPRRPSWPLEWSPRSAGDTALTTALTTATRTAVALSAGPSIAASSPRTFLARQGGPARSRAEDSL